MYVERHSAVPLRRAVHTRLPVLVQGPRGAGKTTLLRHEYPGHAYVSLETERLDPQAALRRLRGPAIVDDIHRAPELIDRSAPYIYVSSIKLDVPIATLELHHPTRAERQRRPSLPLEVLGRFAPTKPVPAQELPPWSSHRHFIDLDLPRLIAVHDIAKFEKFLALARSRSGAILDQQSLARDTKVSHRTIVRWLEVLDKTFQTLLLPAYGQSFGRRIVQRPKLHFIENSAHFESQAVSEIHRNARHADQSPQLRYWRDSNGFEIPLVLDGVPIGIVSEPNPKIESALHRWASLAGAANAAIITNKPAPPGRREGRVLRYAIGQL